MHIIDLFLACQLCPCFLSLLVPDNIIELDKHKEADVVTAEREQDLVASDVIRPVILAVNVAAHDIASLHKPGEGQPFVPSCDVSSLTYMLYKAALMARVRTLLLLREFQATRMAWQYG